MSDLMHLQEIAEYVGVSKRTIRNEIIAGRLPARKTGNGWTTLRHIVVDFREKYYTDSIISKNAEKEA